MASKIPVLDGPTVVSQPSQPVQQERPSAASFGAPLGQAVGDVGEALLKISDSADRERVNVEARKLRDFKAEYVDKPETGALAKRGLAAKGTSEDVDKRFRALAETIKGGLSDRQKRLWDEEVESQATTLRHAVSAHETTELAAEGDKEFVAGLTSRKTDVARMISTNGVFGSAELLSKTRTEIRKDIEARAPIAGWGKEQTEATVRAHITDMHARAIEVLANEKRDYKAAQGYLNMVRSDMDPNTAAEMDKKLRKEGKDALEGQMAFDAWKKIEENSYDSSNRFNDKLAWATFAELPPEDQEMVRVQIHQKVVEANRLQNEDDEQRLGRLEKTISSAGRLDKGLRDYKDLDAKGQALAARLEKTYLRGQRYDNAEIRRMQNDLDTEALNDFVASRPDVDTLAAVTDAQILKESPDASDKARSKMRLIVRNAKLAVEKGQRATSNMVYQITNQAVAGLSDEGKAKVREEMLSWHASQEAPPSRQEALAALGKLVAVHKTSIKDGYLRNKKGYQLTPEERETYLPLPAEEQKTTVAKGYADQRLKPAQPVPVAQPAPAGGKKEFRKDADGKFFVKRGGVKGKTTTIQAGDEAY